MSARASLLGRLHKPRFLLCRNLFCLLLQVIQGRLGAGDALYDVGAVLEADVQFSLQVFLLEHLLRLRLSNGIQMFPGCWQDLGPECVHVDTPSGASCLNLSAHLRRVALDLLRSSGYRLRSSDGVLPNLRDRAQHWKLLVQGDT